MASIRCNKRVREHLVVLDQVFERFHEVTRKLLPGAELARGDTSVSLGADREALRTQIVGIAWRINKASRGEE